MGLALASDTASITVMEIVDNAIMLLIPGAMDAGLARGLFWISLGFSLAVAGAAAFPVNRYLIARGRGHAVMHKFHKHDRAGAADGPAATGVYPDRPRYFPAVAAAAAFPLNRYRCGIPPAHNDRKHRLAARPSTGRDKGDLAMRIHSRFATLAISAFLLSTIFQAPARAAAEDDISADARCLIISMQVLLAGADDAVRHAAMLANVYYLGRLDGRAAERRSGKPPAGRDRAHDAGSGGRGGSALRRHGQCPHAGGFRPRQPADCRRAVELELVAGGLRKSSGFKQILPRWVAWADRSRGLPP